MCIIVSGLGGDVQSEEDQFSEIGGMAMLRVFVAVREDRWSLETALREGELER